MNEIWFHNNTHFLQTPAQEYSRSVFNRLNQKNHFAIDNILKMKCLFMTAMPFTFFMIKWSKVSVSISQICSSFERSLLVFHGNTSMYMYMERSRQFATDKHVNSTNTIMLSRPHRDGCMYVNADLLVSFKNPSLSSWVGNTGMCTWIGCIR